MSLDSDIALLGTGVAPLVAASYLSSLGKSVLLLNPDWDYFLENSELPLDPLLTGDIDPERLKRSLPEFALEQLRLEFPGAVEFWSSSLENDKNQRKNGFHDKAAPHVKQRGRIWIPKPKSTIPEKLPEELNAELQQKLPQKLLLEEELPEQLQDLYVNISDAGLNPQILEGPIAVRRFPGSSVRSTQSQGLYLPRLCDVDTIRYRNGLLEFVRERLSPEKVICNISQLKKIPEGIRFHTNGTARTAKLSIGMLAFFTPRLSTWITSQAKQADHSLRTLPVRRPVRLYEQWTLKSRDPLDPGTIGIYENMTAWTDFEGIPHLEPSSNTKLSVLKVGALTELNQLNLPQSGLNWASSASFDSLSDLCHDFLRWDNFTIRSLQVRAIFDGQPQLPWTLSSENPLILVIPGSDGPLVDVIQTSRNACNQLLEEGEHELRRT
jgi:hypothetical protein